jgi:hypothetical protein
MGQAFIVQMPSKLLCLFLLILKDLIEKAGNALFPALNPGRSGGWMARGIFKLRQRIAQQK